MLARPAVLAAYSFAAGLHHSLLDRAMSDVRGAIIPYLPELTAIRRDLHAHPEIGFEEVRTSSIVADKLRSWGVDVSLGLGRTGLVGTIRGSRPGSRSIGLRADMDALPINEATGLPYASVNPGRMHACGHDGHTAMLLGAARYLASHRDFSGTVNLIFQPAEEGLGGAKGMIADGLFERFPCDSVYGMHNLPGMPVGKFGLREGALLASAGLFEVTFSGKGGHAGLSEHAKYDIAAVLAKYVLALRELAANEAEPGETAVIRVGELEGHGGASLNVMPAKTYVGGTMRCFSPQTRAVFTRRIGELAHILVAEAADASAKVELRWITTALINATAQTGVAARAAAAVAGAHVDTNTPRLSGGEDFAYMMEVRPGSFIFLGNGTEADGHGQDVHTPKYDFNDDIIPYGVEYWVKLVDHELSD
jgi:hippurate hydrolase